MTRMPIALALLAGWVGLGLGAVSLMVGEPTAALLLVFWALLSPAIVGELRDYANV